MLWNIVYDAFLKLALPPGCRLISLADDVVMVVTTATLEVLSTAVTEALGWIETWLLSQKLKLARKKTEAIFLNSKRVLRSFAFTYAGHRITFGKSLRYLGVRLDQWRGCRQHITRVTVKAVRLASSLARLMVNLGGVRKAVSRIYHTVVESVVL